jgi:hypothetical protein
MLTPQEKLGEYGVQTASGSEVHLLRMVDIDGQGKREPVLLGRFSAAQRLIPGKDNQLHAQALAPAIQSPYSDLREVDLNGDGRTDWLTNQGRIWLRGTDGKFAATPSLQLALPAADDWYFCGVGDFNGDRRTDVLFGCHGMQGRRAVHVFHNTGNASAPFAAVPSAAFEIAAKYGHVRDVAPVADWNGDGIDDLVIALGQDNQVRIYLGGADGMNAERVETIPFDFSIHYEHGLTVADFNADGLLDLGCFGYTATGVGLSGPLTAFVWLREKKTP